MVRLTEKTKNGIAMVNEPSIDDVIADAKKWCAEHNTPSSDKMELER